MNAILITVGVVVVTVAIFGIVLASLVYSYQRVKLGKPDPDMVPQVDEETRAEIAALRARVATLERLVTDDDRRIAREIDHLTRPEASPTA